MNLIVGNLFDEDNNLINTTADYNLLNYLYVSPDEDFITIGQKKYEKHIAEERSLCKLEEQYGGKIKNIIFFNSTSACKIEALSCYKDINVYKYIVDMHFDILYSRSIENATLLCTYGYTLGGYNDPKRGNNYFFPHSVMYEIDINSDPINKVLVCGRGRKNYKRYPERHKMYGIKSEYIDAFLPDVSYRTKRSDKKRTFGERFIKKLNEYVCVFCDEGNIDTNFIYIFGKIFEIMSAGALLLASNKATKKYLELIGFKDGEDYVHMDTRSMTHDSIIKFISDLLSLENRERIDNIRRSGYKKVWENHSSKKRLEDLKNILNGGDEYKLYDDGTNGTLYYSKKYN